MSTHKAAEQNKNIRPYVSRKIMGIKDKDVLSKALEGRRNVLLSGPTGSGKTLVTSSFANDNKFLYTKINCSVASDPSALFGRYVPENSSGLKWQDGLITDLIRTLSNDPDQAGVLVLDEVNMLDPRIAATLFPLLDSNRELIILDTSEVIKITHPNLLIVATMNKGYKGTKDLNKAFSNRFSWNFTWGYDKEAEKDLIPSRALRDVFDKLRKAGETEFSTPFSTNMMVEFMDTYFDMGFDFAVGVIANKQDVDDSAQGILSYFNPSKTAICRELDEALEEMSNPEMERVAPLDVNLMNTTGRFHPMGWKISGDAVA